MAEGREVGFIPEVKVWIRKAGREVYYERPGRWTEDRISALDFRGTCMALLHIRSEGLDSVEVLHLLEDDTVDFVIRCPSHQPRTWQLVAGELKAGRGLAGENRAAPQLVPAAEFV